MVDNLKRTRPEDPKKINIHEPWELAYWTKEFGVTQQQIKDAVKAVGVQTPAVAKYPGKKWP